MEKAKGLAALRVFLGAGFLYAGLEKVFDFAGSGKPFTSAGFLQFGTNGTLPGSDPKAIVNPTHDMWVSLATNAAIIDTVGDYALVMLLGRPLPTVNFRVDYLRPAVGTALVVTAKVRRNGRLVGVVDVDVENEAGQLVAIGRATYATPG